MANDALIQQLEKKRPDYDKERSWHRFLLDAYTGGGGFQGRVKQPDRGFWGAASEMYADAVSARWDRSGPTVNTYLDRYPAEDGNKFTQRVDISHYPNYVQPLTDLKLSFMTRKSMSYEEQPDRVAEWRQDIDGSGTTFDEMRPSVLLRAAIVGWCPVLVDMDPVPDELGDGAITRAQAEAAGLRPRMIPLFPGHLLDWEQDDAGNFIWAKIRTSHTVRDDPFEDATQVERYVIWFPDRVQVFEVHTRQNYKSVEDLGDKPHGFGRVPLAILRHSPIPDDDVRGMPMHANVSIEARRLFNLISEFDEHLRSQVFAIFVMATRDGKAPQEAYIGPGDGLTIDDNASQKHYYLSPEGTVADTYENRIEGAIREIYRLARIEYSRPSGASVSGVARKFEFQQTNRAISDFARQVSRWEQDLDDLVGAALGVPEERRKLERVTPPDDFDVQDLATALENAAELVTLEVGPTATQAAKMRVIDEMLPNLPADKRLAIESELEEIASSQAQREAFEAQMMGGALPDDEPSAEGDDG